MLKGHIEPAPVQHRADPEGQTRAQNLFFQERDALLLQDIFQNAGGYIILFRQEAEISGFGLPDLFAAAGRANVGFNNTLAFFAVHFSSSLCSVCISGQYFSLYSSDHIPETA